MIQAIRKSFPLASLVAALCVAGALGAQSIDPRLNLPAESTAGQEIKLPGEKLPTDKGKMTVVLSGGSEASPLRLFASGAEDGKSLIFRLPDALKPGRYLVSVDLGDGKPPLAAPGELRVIEKLPKPVIDYVHPATSYPLGKRFDFTVIGENFAKNGADNTVEVMRQGPIAFKEPDECKKGELPCLTVDSTGRKLSVVGYERANDYQGPLEIRVRVGDQVSDPKPLTLSWMSATGVKVSAVAVFGLLIFIIFRLVEKGVGEEKIGGRHFSPFYAFFMDKQTNTYSLSKFQLVLFTLVAVFGYVYVFLCRLLIQWNLSMPEIPDTLPGMIAISAGTAVAAAGATQARGSKGSGKVHPSPADFITSGGMVIGERFQFFLWTLVGCFGFLALLLRSDPATIKELPNIPPGFLYVMGISSAGYLGGKLVRTPGPVIKSLLVTDTNAKAPKPPAQATMLIHLQGENLSEGATVKVDDKQLREDEFSIKGTQGKKQDASPDPTFYNELDVTLKDAGAYLDGEHQLALTNKDGQMASAQFPLDPLTIDSVVEVKRDGDGVEVKVLGKNFGEPTSAQWAVGDKEPLSAKRVTRTKDSELLVKLPAEAKGEGKLTLVSAIGLRASKQVTIS